MKTIMKSMLSGVVLLFLLAACSGGDAQLGKVVLAREIDSTGQPGESVTRFTPGEKVYLAIEFLGAYQGLRAKVNWLRGDETVASREIEIPRSVDTLEPLWMADVLQTGGDWPVGDYRCELFVPDQGTTRIDFVLEK